MKKKLFSLYAAVVFCYAMYKLCNPPPVDNVGYHYVLVVCVAVWSLFSIVND